MPASGPSAQLYHQHGVALQNVLDTQLCHALKWRMDGRRGRLPDYVAGLKRVLADSGLMRGLEEAQRLKDSVSARFDSDLRLWERRPLGEDLVKYAAYDVALLGPLADHLTAGFQAQDLALARRASARYVALFRDAPEANDRQAPGGRGGEGARLDPALFELAPSATAIAPVAIVGAPNSNAGGSNFYALMRGLTRIIRPSTWL
eukprot:tig00021680_g23032.t1